MRFSLIISDLHFGRYDLLHDKSVEQDFLDLITASVQNLDALYLVGDVFEIFMEYKSVIPARVPRFIGKLCELIDAKIPVYYLTGNRDPWHRRYFAEEVGLNLIKGVLETEIYGQKALLRHGDTLEAHAKIHKTINPLMQKNLLLNALQYGLPGDVGIRFAQYISQKRVAKSPHKVTGNVATHQDLLQYADVLFATNDYDFLAMGHSHIHNLSQHQQGIYLNSGFWNGNRTFGKVNESGIQLCQFNQGILKEMDWKKPNLAVY